MSKSLYVLVAVIALLMCSCQKDGVSLPDGLRPYKLDLSGAKSLGLNNESSATRGSEDKGQLYDRGLFKIDEQGNVSTVAVYFTVDKNGDKKLQDHNISIDPYRMWKITPDYLLLGDCSYYFENGETADELWKYSHLLVRISDGLIFWVSDIWQYIGDDPWGHLTARFIEDDEGNLYFNNGTMVGRITVTDGIATFQQINTTGSGIVEGYTTIHLLKNGVTCTGSLYELSFLWPNGGFCYSTDIDDFNLDRDDYSKPWFQFVEGGVLFVRELSDEAYTTSLYNVIVGDTPGDVSLSEPLLSVPSEIFPAIDPETFFETETHYLLFGNPQPGLGPHHYVLAINKQSLEWEKIRVLFYPKFTPMHEYDGKYWLTTEIGDENGNGFYWFDSHTFQSGFVKADTPFVSSFPTPSGGEYDYSNGYITYEAIRQSDGYNITVKIDITTGQAEVLERAPEKAFAILVTLS